MTNENEYRIYRISASELRRLRMLAEREQKASQGEVCGMILSNDGRRLRLTYLPNQTRRPGRFMIRKRSREAAEGRAKTNGAMVLGTFHSHPVSEAIPGARDLKDAATGSLMLIYDVCGKEAKLWKIRKFRRRAQAQELTLRISKDVQKQPGRNN